MGIWCGTATLVSFLWGTVGPAVIARPLASAPLSVLAISLVILGILAALVVPQVMSRPDQAKVTVAKGDIKAIAAALDMYKLDNFAYPSTQQGLDALVKKPSGNPQPKNWNRDGYLKRLPKDPWGNDYRYLSPGTQGQFDLYSFGADGKPGGSDLNADIGNWDL